jgi:hypothetical protein
MVSRNQASGIQTLGGGCKSFMRRAATKRHPAQATPKEIVAVVRALEQILADLRQGRS